MRCKYRLEQSHEHDSFCVWVHIARIQVCGSLGLDYIIRSLSRKFKLLMVPIHRTTTPTQKPQDT